VALLRALRLDDVLVPFYIFWLIESFGLTSIAPMAVSMPDFGLAVRWIRKEWLARFANPTGYDKVPLEGYALG